MTFYQAIVDGDVAAGLMRRLAREGVAFLCAPYPFVTPGGWRFLAAGGMGAPGEFEVGHITAMEAARAMSREPGAKRSASWLSVAKQFTRGV